MSETAAQRKAREKYEAKPETQAKKAGIYLKLNRETDADILEKLASVPNVQGYIKELIRADMARGK